MRRPAVKGLLALLAITFLAVACSRGGERVPLDGSPRPPDDEGVVTEISHDELTLDGRRTYKVSDNLLSFSTYTAALEPMLGRKGQYVHVGLEDGQVVWMAGIAGVVPGEPPTVFYQGRFARMEDGKAVFDDGTVLDLGDVAPPEKGQLVTVEIDANRHAARSVKPV